MANTNRKPGKAKPISSHPLFPVVVALWFGALLGLGSLAIRSTLLEAIVVKTGVDLLVPAAAPPLGITARILIATALAAAGAAVGAALALRIGRPKIVTRRRKRNAGHSRAAAKAESAMWNNPDPIQHTPARRPISAHEELGEALVSRRRPLAVEQAELSFAPLESAPLPGGEPALAGMAAATGFAMSDAAPLSPPPLDLGAFPAPGPAEPVMPALPVQLPLQQAMPPQPAAPAVPVVPQGAPAPGPDGITDLAKRLQETMARCRAAIAAADTPKPLASAPDQAAAPAAAPDFVPPPPLDNLFPVDAIETAPPPATAIPGAPMPMPAALRPVSLEPAEDEDEDALELATLVPRHLAMPAKPVAAPAGQDGFAPPEAKPQNPRQEFVRIEEPLDPAAAIEPVVIFPGQMAAAPTPGNRPFDNPASPASPAAGSGDAPAAAVDPGDAERALRLALASLQRVSGAA